ncbi:MAG: glycosyl transferase family 1 [Terriglobia bacterium]|nr:MAG: glycosyl transferase family 1 [Terriglobia bacterium]
MPDGRLQRILMTADTVGGVWSYVLELAGALGARGIEVVLAAMGGEPSEKQHAEAARLSNVLLFASDFRLEWMRDPWEDIERSGQWLLDLASRYRPDLVHLNSYGHGALPWGRPVVLTAHSCVLSWWAAVKGGDAPPAWDRYRQQVRRSVQAADVLTAPSRAMLDAIDEHYGPGLPAYRAVISNGRRMESRSGAQKEPFALTAGRLWDDAKNARAVAGLAGRIPWPVYLAGESAPFDGCRMLGRLSSDELAGWFARASIYVLPARYEPFGLSALEAALAGCALVLGDIPSLREVWGDAAIYVSPDDPDQLAGSVNTLINDPLRRRGMALRALTRARRYTPDRMCRGYLEAYDAAAATRGAACVS